MNEPETQRAEMSLEARDWVCKAFVGEDWLWRDAHKPDTRDVLDWLPASVPGSVYDDLWRAGEIPNPYVERNSLLVEWVSARTWLYKKTFVAGEEWRGRRIRLCFAGVDYEARFYLNGDLLGRHAGMFTPAVFDVGDKLVFGGPNQIWHHGLAGVHPVQLRHRQCPRR